MATRLKSKKIKKIKTNFDGFSSFYGRSESARRSHTHLNERTPSTTHTPRITTHTHSPPILCCTPHEWHNDNVRIKFILVELHRKYTTERLCVCVMENALMFAVAAKMLSVCVWCVWWGGEFCIERAYKKNRRCARVAFDCIVRAKAPNIQCSNQSIYVCCICMYVFMFAQNYVGKYIHIYMNEEWKWSAALQHSSQYRTWSI